MTHLTSVTTLVVAFLVGSAHAPAAVVAHYQLEGNGNDTVGNVTGANASQVGSVNYTAGVFGQAADFNGGTTNYLNTSAPASNFGIGGANERTITAWVRTDGWNEGGIWSLGNNSGQQHFTLRTRGNPDEWRGQFWSGDQDFVTSGLTGNWALMSMTYEDPAVGNDITRIYVNGQEVTQRTANLNTADTFPFRIGNYQNNASGTGITFDGLVDDVGVWDRTLTPAESLAVYNLGLPSSFANLTSPFGLNYDVSVVDSLFELHNSTSGQVEIDDLTWVPFDDIGLISGLGLSPGQIGQLDDGQFVLALTASTGVQTTLVPEPTTLAIWAFVLGLIGVLRRFALGSALTKSK